MTQMEQRGGEITREFFETGVRNVPGIECHSVVTCPLSGGLLFWILQSKCDDQVFNIRSIKTT